MASWTRTLESRCVVRATTLITLLLFAGALIGSASAVAQPDPFADDEDAGGPFLIGGNVKTFATGMFPYEHLLLPDDPVVSGLAVGRVTVDVTALEVIDAELHGLFAATSAGGATGGFLQSGVAVGRPEAIDLSWELSDSPLGGLTFVIDRAAVTAHLPHVDLTVGRQPVSFGAAYFFTPMDLVSPFSPATIDREYKPGVDAFRADFYFGMATQITAVAAYADDWSLDGLIVASHARTNIAGSDVGLFLAEARGDLVTGVDIATDAFGVGLRGEATATFPDNETEGAFIRAVVGADVILPYNASLLGEVYVQTLGADDPADYLAFTSGERFSRGELSLAGRLYGAAAFSWELSPILRPGISALINLEDGSVSVSPTVSWSVADEVSVAFGAQVSTGERPRDIAPADLVNPDGTPKTEAEIAGLFVPESEFGLYPSVVFLQMSAYF